MSNDADDPAAGTPGNRRRLPIIHLRQRSGSDDSGEGIAARLAQQWATRRDERGPAPVPIVVDRSSPAQRHVPWGVDLAASWAWRFLVIAAAAYVILWLVAFFAVVAIPVAIALLVSALVIPLVDGLHRVGLPRGLSALLVVIMVLAVIGALLTFAGQQVANGAQDLADQASAGLEEIKDWLKDGPLNASDSQINDYIQRAQDGLKNTGSHLDLGNVTEVGTALGHVFAGFFIVLFSTYFFLADGERIWAWAVRLAPRGARPHVDSSGRVAWISLTQFVRATVIVAAVDAMGIMIGAAVLGVPFVLAIGVLVFLGAFVPMVGATVAGTVAILVALVAQGPFTALLMLAVVIGVQQLEGHVLQPFLMGRWVSLHPLGVIVAIGCGVIVAGIAGALVAVPLAAALNAVVQHLAANTDPDGDPVDELVEDYEEKGATVDAPEEGDDD
ncbi:MAG TPA: AI-2E family transporter [Nocardioides sp.]|nr:AI-2E family transporter [Nocardioides sp.]